MLTGGGARPRTEVGEEPCGSPARGMGWGLAEPDVGQGPHAGCGGLAGWEPEEATRALGGWTGATERESDAVRGSAGDGRAKPDVGVAAWQDRSRTPPRGRRADGR